MYSHLEISFFIVIHCEVEICYSFVAYSMFNRTHRSVTRPVFKGL